MAAQQLEQLPEPDPDERPQRRREWTGAWRSVILPLVAVGLIVFAVWYLEAGRGSGSHAASGTGVVTLPAAKNHTGKPASTDVGRAAPDFVLQKLGGGTLRLSDFQGKTVLLNFWATWCGPCRDEMPEIVKTYNQYKDQNFIVISVDEQEDPGTVQKFVNQFGMDFPVVLDTSGQVGETFHAGSQFPTSVFVDPDGTIKPIHNETGAVSANHPGPMTAPFITQQITTQP
jgi:thiol-disulfide isomerase/thioredoxin